MQYAVRELPQVPMWLSGMFSPEGRSILFLVLQSLVIFLAVVILSLIHI